jgi:hypothetical protein
MVMGGIARVLDQLALDTGSGGVTGVFQPSWTLEKFRLVLSGISVGLGLKTQYLIRAMVSWTKPKAKRAPSTAKAIPPVNIANAIIGKVKRRRNGTAKPCSTVLVSAMVLGFVCTNVQVQVEQEQSWFS